MKLTKKLLEQMIEEATGEGYWDDETGEWVDPQEEEEQEVEVVGTFGGRKQWDREAKQPAGPGIQLPKVKPQGPKSNFSDKDLKAPWLYNMIKRLADEEQEWIADQIKKGHIRKDIAEIMTKNDIVEMIKEEITNIFNGE